MTVKEAIAILQTKNPDALLCISDSDGGIDDNIIIIEKNVQKNFWDEQNKGGYFLFVNYADPEKNTVDIVLIK